MSRHIVRSAVRRAGAARAMVAGAAITGAVAGAGAWSGGCGDPQEPFLCGFVRQGRSGSVQECTEPGEICVCETHSCARKVATTLCRSGYQYLEEPFSSARAREEADRGTDEAPQPADLRCVPEGHLAEKIEVNSNVRACVDSPKGSGGEGGTGGQASAGGAGGAGGAGSGAGGTGGAS